MCAPAGGSLRFDIPQCWTRPSEPAGATFVLAVERKRPFRPCCGTRIKFPTLPCTRGLCAAAQVQSREAGQPRAQLQQGRRFRAQTRSKAIGEELHKIRGLGRERGNVLVKR